MSFERIDRPPLGLSSGRPSQLGGQARLSGARFMLVRHLAHQCAKPFKTDAIAREADVFRIEFTEPPRGNPATTPPDESVWMV
jgi:hypothetical protein